MPISNEWQVQCGTEKDRNKHLLDSGLWSDVKLVVGTGEQQICINAHKLQLAKASPVFAELYYGPQDNSPSTTTILDYETNIVSTMIRYIYTYDVDFESVEMALKLGHLASAYVLPVLVAACVTYIKLNITAQNACKVYEFGGDCQDPELMDKAMMIIRHNTKSILKDNGFVDVRKKTIIDILDQEQLNVDSELDLFNALVYTREHTTLSTCDLVKKIRFLTLTQMEFINGPGETGMLTETETSRILQIITSPKIDVPMPDGFSTSKTKRIKPVKIIPNLYPSTPANEKQKRILWLMNNYPNNV